jgi:hypothetical protein
MTASQLTPRQATTTATSGLARRRDDLIALPSTWVIARIAGSAK